MSSLPDVETIARVHSRTLRVVIASQILGGAGLAAGISVGALLAQDMLGTDALSGIPTALFTLGSALAAFSIGHITQRFGRRMGLACGFLTGGVGATGVVIAAAVDSIVLLLVCLLVYGAGTATNLQARYAGTDLAPPDKRATGTSMAMVATTLGAVAGPNLVVPLGALAEGIGIPPLAGPFILAAVAYISAGAVLWVLLRPDPFLLARSLSERGAEKQGLTIVTPAAHLGAVVMVLTQLVMVAIMTMTPVHMRTHDHSLGAVGLVIGLHIGAMWLPSLVTGRLVDTVGRTPTVIASGVTLLMAGMLAAFAPVGSLPLLIFALVLLGLGWNLGVVAGTALVVDGTGAGNRATVQGTVDVAVALSGAAGGLASGLVLAASSYQVLSLVAAVLVLVLVPVVILTKGALVATAPEVQPSADR
jgi:Arabinose efflux permease